MIREQSEISKKNVKTIVIEKHLLYESKRNTCHNYTFGCKQLAGLILTFTGLISLLVLVLVQYAPQSKSETLVQSDVMASGPLDPLYAKQVQNIGCRAKH